EGRHSGHLRERARLRVERPHVRRLIRASGPGGIGEGQRDEASLLVDFRLVEAVEPARPWVEALGAGCGVEQREALVGPGEDELVTRGGKDTGSRRHASRPDLRRARERTLLPDLVTVETDLAQDAARARDGTVDPERLPVIALGESARDAEEERPRLRSAQDVDLAVEAAGRDDGAVASEVTNANEAVPHVRCRANRARPAAVDIEHERRRVADEHLQV